MTATEHTRDFLGRRLRNANPGVTNPVQDFLSRGIKANETDYMGRALHSLPGSISGTVTDDGDSSPIEGAVVTAGDAETETDENGAYALTVDEGSYTVEVTADGYVTDDQSGVAVNSEEAVTGIDFALVADE